MIPPLKARARAQPMPIAGNWYGTTLRIYDPAIDAWRIFWCDPATNAFRQQIGRRGGVDIVQEGQAGGGFSRWSFTAITPHSFRRLGEGSQDGASWRLIVEVLARRTSTDAAPYPIPAYSRSERDRSRFAIPLARFEHALGKDWHSAPIVLKSRSWQTREIPGSRAMRA